MRLAVGISALCLFGTGVALLPFWAPSLALLLLLGQWLVLYGDTFTRLPHAFFNQRNILDTYQPRYRVESVPITPERPPWGISSSSTRLPPCRAATLRNGRRTLSAPPGTPSVLSLKILSQHYADEYSILMKKNKELEEAEKRGASPRPETSSSSTRIEFPEADKKKMEEEDEEKDDGKDFSM